MDILNDLVYLLSTYRYPFVFFATILQGPTVMLASGFLLRLGNFTFLPLYLILILGDFVADMLWYWIGYSWAEPFLRRFGYAFGVTHKAFDHMKGIFRRHDTTILFVSKITMGFGFALATLMAAGATRVP